ncbi:MAG: GrlR family regulatory protein [Vampirovibrionales bacterium]|nr:GrlR family regulatory protein [Vampirovibrionales bacterium]
MLTNGLYKASFKTPTDFGDGVIYLQDGNAYGGDSNFYYTAQYSVQNDKMVANFAFKQHTPGNESVFGVDSGTLEVSGTYTFNSATDCPPRIDPIRTRGMDHSTNCLVAA